MTGKAGAAKADWKHVANEYYPEDLQLSFEEAADQEERNELYSFALQEICDILSDWDPDDCVFDPSGWMEAEGILEEYVDVLDSNGYELPEWLDQDYASTQSAYIFRH